MAATGALQAMGGNVVMSKQLCGRPCVCRAHHSHHRYNAPAAAPCRYCSCNAWTEENYTIFANCVLTSARRLMNHTISKAHRQSLQPSASVVTDRGRIVDPAGSRRSCVASASQAAPKAIPRPKTNSSVSRPPPPPTPEEDPDVLRQQAASALSRAVEWSRTEARKKPRANSKEPFDAIADLEKRRTLLSNALIG